MRIVGHKQVEQSVAIVIKPGRTCAPSARVFHPRVISDIRECAIPVVVKKRVRLEASDVQIGEPVIIEIGCGNSHTVERQPIDSSFYGYIFKVPIPQISIKRIHHRNRTLAARSFSAINEENVLQSIAIEIQERYSASHGFDKEAIGRLSAELFPLDASLLSDVSEIFR